MSISTKHPSYDKMVKPWAVMRDVSEGSDTIKAKGSAYLMPTEAMVLDGCEISTTSVGYKNYTRYVNRAIFPEYTSESIRRYVGRLNMKPPTVEVPDAMRPMLERITAQGETLNDFIKRIHVQQLTCGRAGLMLDLPQSASQANPLPYLSLYYCETCINWDTSSQNSHEEQLNLVVMEEFVNVRNDNLSWGMETQYRVLFLDNISEDGELVNGVYHYGVFDSAAEFSVEGLTPPMLRGQTLNEIPFVFINANHITPDVERPPLKALADACLSIYNSEADYRQSLHMQGQDTLVVIGGVIGTGDPTAIDDGDDGVRVGAGARLDLNIDGDAKYIGVSSSGLREQREAILQDRKEAQTIAGQVVQERANRESGDAIRSRVSAQTTTLKDIAQTSAAGLEHILRIAARWMGLNDEEVIVKPNLDFDDSNLDTQALVSLAAAEGNGLPLSKKSMHDYLARKDFTELSFEQELEQMEKERKIEVLKNDPQTSTQTNEEIEEPRNDA